MPLFKSKIGLIAATVGSAVGLGTVWRFPAETQANGGAAFLLVYIACVFLLGVPVMLAEFSLGRGERSDAVGVFRKLSPGKAWWLIGAGAVLVSFLIMCFYMVVGGWTLEYLWGSVSGELYNGLEVVAATTGRDMYFTERMQEYVTGDWMPVAFTMVCVVLNIFILLGGVQKGIERMSNIMMPMLFVLLVVFCVVTLTLPGAGKGVEFFLKPDFSKITPSVCLSALGQALFSLSLAMGILVTYASYYPANTNLGKTSVTVSALTILVALLMGLIIFPAVAAFNLSDASLRGTTLVFVTLPEVFAGMPCPAVWSALFFLLLSLAAITSTVSLSEVSVRLLQEQTGLGRTGAVLWVLCPVLLLSAICAMSFGLLKGVTVFDLNIFELLDALTNNYMLPAVALFTCLYMGWVAPRNFMRDQLSNNGTLRASYSSVVVVVVRYFAPVAILAIQLSYLGLI